MALTPAERMRRVILNDFEIGPQYARLSASDRRQVDALIERGQGRLARQEITRLDARRREVQSAARRARETRHLASGEFRTLDAAIDYAAALPARRRFIITAYGDLHGQRYSGSGTAWKSLSTQWARASSARSLLLRQQWEAREQEFFSSVYKYGVSIRAIGVI